MTTEKTGSQDPGKAGETPKVFTQEEVNVIAGRARIEERQKYPDYDDLKTRAAKADELERAQLTEVDRVRQDLAVEQRKNLDAEGRIASTMITTEIRVKAVQRGIVDPDAAVALLDRSHVAYTEEAGVAGVDAALDALVMAKPYLKGQAFSPNLNPGGGTAPKPVTLTAEQKEAAVKLGVTEQNYAKHLNPG